MIFLNLYLLQIFTHCSRSTTWRVPSRNIRRSTAALNFELPAILRPARSRSLLLLLLNFRLHQVDRAFHSSLAAFNGDYSICCARSVDPPLANLDISSTVLFDLLNITSGRSQNSSY